MEKKEDLESKMKREQSYNYLCCVEEVRLWLQIILESDLPTGVEFEDKLSNGVMLAKLAHFISPQEVLLSKIYDINESVYAQRGLCFKHTENINLFLNVLKKIKLPRTDSLETMDIYGKNNIPKLITFLHLLISHLRSIKRNQCLDSISGKIAFTDDEIELVNRQLKEHGYESVNFETLKEQTKENIPISAQDKGSYEKSYETQNEVISQDEIEEEEDKENQHYGQEKKNSKAYAMNRLNRALDKDSLEDFIDAIKLPSLGLGKEKLLSHFIPLYFIELKEDKKSQGLISGEGLDSTIDVLFSIAVISEAVDSTCADRTWVALNSCSVVFQGLDFDLKNEYIKTLRVCKHFLETEPCECKLLTYMNIQDCIDLVNIKAKSPKRRECDALKAMEDYILADDIENFYTDLMSPIYDFDKSPLNLDNAWVMFKHLKNRLSKTSGASSISMDVLKQSISHIKDFNARLNEDIEWLQKITAGLIQSDTAAMSALILQLNGANDKNVPIVIHLMKMKKKKLIGNSSIVKHTIGDVNLEINLSTGKYICMKSNENSNPDHIVKDSISFGYIEGLIRYVDRHKIYQKISRLQALCKGYLVRTKIKLETSISNDSSWLKSKKDPVVTIQAAWRGYRVRKIFKRIMSGEDVTYRELRSFMSLVVMSTDDYEKEIHLQALRGLVVQSIKKNSELRDQINKMDITIGLLVQNKISLMDALEESRKIGIGVSGLKSLHADCRKTLEGYQHLFYTLQTSPHYLAKLVFCLPPNKSFKFLQSVIFSLYSFGANQRNEYLLVKLFQYALHEEIRCKFSSPNDVITGNPLVLKLVVNYARFGKSFKQVLSTLVSKVLNNQELVIETNPISLYNHWRNETEMSSGKSFDLPHSVPYDVALSHKEVLTRLEKALGMLKSNVSMILKTLVNSKDSLPYGLRFIAKELKSALLARFPDTSTKEIIKVIGNMIYYQFINPALVAPDVFDVISSPTTLTSEKRHTLATIAKILQFAAAKKGFGEESKHLMCLNPFIIECHEIFKEYFIACCDVEDLDKHFSMNEYTEDTLITSPSIYISLQEIIQLHSLMKKYKEEIVSDSNDPLHELLNDLGSVPTLSQLSGYDESSEYDERQIAKTEVCITLKNKFEGCRQDNTDLSKLFIKTKELLVMVFPYLSGHTLIGALRIENTNEDADSFLNKNPGESSLKECKSRALKYLRQLNEEGVISRENGYQSILNSIAADICNKNKYRMKQAQDLKCIKETLKSLQDKTEYYQEQILSYQQYIERCLENLNAGKRNVHLVKKNHPNEKFSSKHTLKYTGAKLHEKGVLISIEGLPVTQFKNIQFEICPSDHNGIFNISGKFMGVEVERVEVDMQELLQLQYNGVGVKNIFGKATININLLLFLLNAKYYKRN